MGDENEVVWATGMWRGRKFERIKCADGKRDGEILTNVKENRKFLKIILKRKNLL